MKVSVSTQGLHFESLPRGIASIDIFLNGQRVWSPVISSDSPKRQEWPGVLRDRFFGFAEAIVRESSTQEVLFSAKLNFDESGEQFSLLDEHGRHLMVNKWLRLAPSLNTPGGPDLRDTLAEVLSEAVHNLQSLGHPVFAVGGTALGPFRDGDFLPHDDDGDLAVLFRTEIPAEIATGMLEVQRELTVLGYRVRVHSYAHLQVYPPESAGSAQGLYFDVFAAFFKSGTINQPFHVRGPFSEQQLLPFANVDVRGYQFPVARDTESWLSLNYDPHWRTPQPGFQLRTPQATVRRFRSWFGSFNQHRHFWEEYLGSSSPKGDYCIAGRGLPGVELHSETVVNAGCGARFELPASVQQRGRQANVVSIDYADAVPLLAQASSGSRRDVRQVNFADYRQVLELVATLPSGPFDVYAGFSLENQDLEGRASGIWGLLRISAASGGTCVVDFVTSSDRIWDDDDPRTWFISERDFIKEAQHHKLDVSVLGRGKVLIDGRLRRCSRAALKAHQAVTSAKGKV